MSIFGSLFSDKKKKTALDLNDIVTQQPGQTGVMMPMTGGMGTAVQPSPLSYADGGKMGWKDGLGLALMGVGDAFTRAGGGQGNAMTSMIDHNMKQSDALKKHQQDVAEAQALAQQSMGDLKKRGMTEEDARLAMLNPGAIGSSIAEQLKPDTPDELTKQMIAAGIDPKGPQGQEIYKNIVQNRADPVSVIPGGGYAASRSTLAGMAGNNIPPPPISAAEFNSAPGITPQTNAQPTTGAQFTQEQYRGIVNSLGQAGADAYMRRNNMTVGGY